MRTFIGLQRLIIGVGACLAAAIAGCALEPGTEGGASADDSAGAEDIGQSRQALYTHTQDGFKITWTYVGHPYAARKIAACLGGDLYALNDDYRLFKNTSGGSDNGWQFVDWPAAAREIACSGSTVYALNADKNLYKSFQPPGWQWVGKPTQAEHLATGYLDIVALNFNKDIYTGYGTDAGWTFRNHAGAADRVTGTDGRAFALNTDKSLWYNDKLMVSQSGANWHPLYNAGLSLLEISLRSPTTLFGLTTTFDLWRADIVETSCADGIDNDGSGAADGQDMGCLEQFAEPFCAAHANGDYCVSRFYNGNGHAIASCKDGKVEDVWGTWGCTCELGSPGADYMECIG